MLQSLTGDSSVGDLLGLLEAVEQQARSAAAALREKEPGTPGVRAAFARALGRRSQPGDRDILSAEGAQLVLIRDINAERLEAHVDDVSCVIAAGQVVILARLSRLKPVGRRQAPAQRVLDRLSPLAPRATFAVSKVLDQAHDIAAALVEAQETLDIAIRRGQRIAFASECWADLAYARLRSVASGALGADNPILRLREESTTELGRTVATWISLSCSARDTAEELNLHVNTVRYRLRRATEVFGLDLENPKHRLLVHLLLSAD